MNDNGEKLAIYEAKCLASTQTLLLLGPYLKSTQFAVDLHLETFNGLFGLLTFARHGLFQSEFDFGIW